MGRLNMDPLNAIRWLQILSATALAGAGSTPASAETAAWDVTGTAKPVCTAGTNGALAFGSLVDSSTGANTVPSQVQSIDTSAICNEAVVQITVQRTNLKSN